MSKMPALYAHLLKPDEQKAQGTTISGAPVKYDVKKEQGDEQTHKKKDASLNFQPPIRRPQVQQKPKPKPSTTSSSSVHKFSSSTVGTSASSPEKQGLGSAPPQQPGVQRSNFEDWVGDDDDEFYYQDRKKYHERGGKKKKKKTKGQETRVWDWDDIYDPTLPNNYADYKGSEEQHREIRDWKARLYYHQLKEAKKANRNGSVSNEGEQDRPRQMNSMFAPPSNLNFAPPSFDDNARAPLIDDDDEYYPPSSDNGRKGSDAVEPPSSAAAASIPDDATGEDAYMRRMRMSGVIQDQPQATPQPAVATPPAPTPSPTVKKSEIDLEAKKAEAAVKIAAFKAKLAQQKSETPPPVTTQAPVQPIASAVETQEIDAKPVQPVDAPPPPPPPVESGSTISRAPVRYDVPPAASSPPEDSDTPMTDAGESEAPKPATEQQRTSKPGQKGFAERMMKKMGWEKGQGLGAKGEGITTALAHKVDKRKKRSDAEGGGWAQPANMGKIVGGKRRKLAEEEGDAAQDARYGKPSEVIKLEGMLDGLDIQKEIEDNNLMQEIGDEMNNKYGNVERLFIWRSEMGGNSEVFVKFNSQLGALRAVNETDGMTFAGNDVVARFWDAEKFEKGEYA